HALSAAILTATLVSPLVALSDDTEIFAGNPAVTGLAPNVLIILDNSANWSASFDSGTKFSSEMATISALIGTLNTNVNVGVMLFGETGPGSSAPISTYIRYAIRNMTGGNKSALQNMITGLTINGDKSNN